MFRRTKPRKWREENGVIYFSVTSDGTTGPEWIERLERRGFQLGNVERSILRSSDFKTTSGVTYEVAVFNKMIDEGGYEITPMILDVAEKRGFTIPNPELACLIREKFTDKDIRAMGLLFIVAMHKPIKSFIGFPSHLSASCVVNRLMYATPSGKSGWNEQDWKWNYGFGFAFIVSETSTPKVS